MIRPEKMSARDRRIATLDEWRVNPGEREIPPDRESWYDLGMAYNCFPFQTDTAIIVTSYKGQLAWLKPCLASYRATGKYVICAYDNPLLPSDPPSWQSTFPDPDTWPLAHSWVFKHVTYNPEKRLGWYWDIRYAQGIVRQFGNMKYVFINNGDCWLGKPEGLPELSRILGDGDLMAQSQWGTNMLHTASVLFKADVFHAVMDYMDRFNRVFTLGGMSPEVCLAETISALGLKVVAAPKQPKFDHGPEKGLVDAYSGWMEPSTWLEVMGWRNLHAEAKYRVLDRMEPLPKELYDLRDDGKYLPGWERETLLNFYKTGDRRYVYQWWDQGAEHPDGRYYPLDHYGPDPIYEEPKKEDEKHEFSCEGPPIVADGEEWFSKYDAYEIRQGEDEPEGQHAVPEIKSVLDEEEKQRMGFVRSDIDSARTPEERAELEALLARYMVCDEWAKRAIGDTAILITSHPANRPYLKACLETHKKLGFWICLSYDNFLKPGSEQSVNDVMPARDVLDMVDTFVMPHHQTWGGVLYPYFWLVKWGLGVLRDFKWVYCINGDCIIEKPEGWPKMMELLGDRDILGHGWSETSRPSFWSAAFVGKTDALWAMWKHYEKHFVPFDNFEKYTNEIGNCENRMAKAILDLGLKNVIVENAYNEQAHIPGHGTWWKVLGFRHIHAEHNYAYRHRGTMPPEPQWLDSRYMGREYEQISKYWETKDESVLNDWWAKE